VAMHFILNPLKKPCVNHKDGDRINNHMRNLEWCTYKENENHSYDILGKINHNRKLSAEALEDIRSNAIKGVNKSNKGNVDKFASKYNVKSGTILNVLKNKFYVRT
jgi:hypothetical protein